MEFTASDGKIVPEKKIKELIHVLVYDLNKDGRTFFIFWEEEFLEWYLDKQISKDKEGDYYIQLHKDITKEDLEQLKQLRDYLEL